MLLCSQEGCFEEKNCSLLVGKVGDVLVQCIVVGRLSRRTNCSPLVEKVRDFVPKVSGNCIAMDGCPGEQNCIAMDGCPGEQNCIAMDVYPEKLYSYGRLSRGTNCSLVGIALGTVCS